MSALPAAAGFIALIYPTLEKPSPLSLSLSGGVLPTSSPLAPTVFNANVPEPAAEQHEECDFRPASSIVCLPTEPPSKDRRRSRSLQKHV